MERNHHEQVWSNAVRTVNGRVFLTAKLFDGKVGKKINFERNDRAFHSRLQSIPEYALVEVIYQLRKGGFVLLKGSVSDKASHDHPISMTQGFLLCQDLGVDLRERVSYPGKPTKDEANHGNPASKRRISCSWNTGTAGLIGPDPV